jgi:hypothetical protein
MPFLSSISFGPNLSGYFALILLDTSMRFSKLNCDLNDAVVAIPCNHSSDEPQHTETGKKQAKKKKKKKKKMS